MSKKPQKKPADPILHASTLRIREMRKRLHAGTITNRQFHSLLEKEQQRNEWASRVQLQSIARDLLPVAAAQARKGRSRLLAVLSNILLKTEMSEIGEPIPTPFNQHVEILHHVGRPDRSEYDPALQATVEEMVTETLEKEVGHHADEHTTKH